MLYLWVVITVFLLIRNIQRFHPSTYNYYIEKILNMFKEKQFMKIVFVCTGNACRSAAAEVILKKMLADNDIYGVDVSSCGTEVPYGLKRDPVMCNIAKESGYEMGGNAIALNEDLLNSADLIIVMTKRQKDDLTRLLTYDHWDRMVRFNEYCFGDKSDLQDPHFQTAYVYRTCFKTIENGCRVIVRKIEETR